MTTKTFVAINYDYTGTMIATFQTSTDNEDGSITYGSYDAEIVGTDKTAILNILNPL